MEYVSVVIDNKSRYTDRFYTYRADMPVRVGSVVSVPFNKGNRKIKAFVFQTGIKPEIEDSKIKSIISVDPVLSLTDEMVDTCCWMRKRYGIRYIDAVKCFIPPGKAPKPGKNKVPYSNENIKRDEPPELTEEQRDAVDKINFAVDSDENKSFLIHGVTSSGKTEIYMRAIQEAINQGKTAIMLVPEIMLAEQVVLRFIARFGREQVAVLHSKLTQRERYDEWARLRRGEAKIAIGARIGVFAPLENIGVIVLDEEHESTYKSDQSPNYETVDIAMKRLMKSKGVLILGSATPSVVSYERAKEGIYELITLDKRYNETPLPSVDIIDMKEEIREGNLSILSSELYRGIRECLDNKKQAILFINRRGYSTVIRCDDCGEVLKCPDCDITLVYHKSENAGVCHYCGRKYRIPETCPTCGGRHLKFYGTGTEKVEELTQEMFPEARIARLDLDTVKSRGAIRKVLNDFAKGKIDILVGTQLIAKGLDFSNVALTGVIAADTTLSIPDYRSTERTFQLITQVAGRAGRGSEQGRVIVQSFTPDNFAIKAAAKHSYLDFFNEEVQMRRLMDYPPFSDLISAEFTSESDSKAYDAAAGCRSYLMRAGLPGSDKIFRPKLDSLFKGKDSSRYHIMIKAPKGERNKYVYYIRYYASNYVEKSGDVAVVIDVNPYSGI
ncbi:MAG: primosomal protein N' [Eubacteriales bacterium]|nr:primosomal protein N' [Eubacteriales bacterium]